MNALFPFSWLNAPAWLPLVHALLHTLWQGALAAGGLLLVLRCVPVRRAHLRYGLSAASLALVILAGVGTWALMDPPRFAPVGARHGNASPATAAGRLPEEDAPSATTALPDAVRKNSAVRATDTPVAASGANVAGPKRWVQWTAAGWLLGAGVSLLRAVGGVLGAGRLRRRCRELVDPRVLALAEQLRARLGVSRRVRFLVCDEIGVPSMLGIVYPAVLLPASLLTGVPLEQLRAILAHELAHIRRWDYLANLAQTLVEALLFFNPFVWWISRQVRSEREACCDQVAAAECGSPACYVEALVAVIQRARGATPPAPILAAAGGSALERARRLLVPGYQPALRLRWYSLALVLTLSGSVLGGLWLGTRAVAQTIKTAEQKTSLGKAEDPTAGSPRETAYEVKVATADGLPLGEWQAVMHYHSQFANSGMGGDGAVQASGLYTLHVPADTNTEYVAASKEGYATVFAKPFTSPEMGGLNGLELKLTRGHAAAIETVDETGRPVADAVLSARYPGPPPVEFGELKTDAAGRATLEHLGAAPLDVRVRADGYEADEVKGIPLDPSKPYRWTLRKTPPLRGAVTDASTGQPIVGAVVRLAYAQGASTEDHLWPGSGPVLATTDARGGFALTSLRADSHYWFYVDAPEYGGAYVSDVTLAQDELKVALGPEVTIRGKVIHIPPTAIHEGKITLEYDQTFRVGQYYLGKAVQSVELIPVNGEADFTVGPFYTAYPEVYTTTPNEGGSLRWWHDSVTLSVGDLPRAYYVPGDPLPDSFVLDLAPKPGGDATPAASPSPSPTAALPGVPADVLAAAREGDAKRALSLLEASVKPKKLGEEDTARLLDTLLRARELRAFTTVYDSLWHHNSFKWKPDDETLAGLVKDGRTDFLDVLVAHRLDLARLSKAAATAEPATAAWITRRVAEENKRQADIAALCQAASANDLPAMGRLVDGGADVNGVGKDDNTPLLRAVFKNHLEAAGWLLDHGAQVDKPRLPGWNYTPLCLVNSVPMAELLKQHGADVHAKLYERDVSILTYVVLWAKADVVAWFLKQGLDANMTGDNGENLLFDLRDGATAEVLLAAGADPNRVDEFGHTPLTSAQNGEVVRALVQHGANLKPKLKDDKTLLEYAVNNTRRTDDTAQEQASYIEELIKQGVEFDPKGNGVRAMISAAFHDRVGEVRVFLDHGVSPNAAYENSSGEHESALFEAAMQAPKSLKLLLERGADPNAPVPAGQMTPLEIALSWGAFGNVDVLRQAGAKGLSDLAYHSARGDVAEVDELLRRHADPNETNSTGWTPLCYAVRRAQVEVAKRLLDGGANVSQFDRMGLSAYLYFALYQKPNGQGASQAEWQWRLPAPEANARLVAFRELFTQHPPDFAYRNSEGRTALHQAVWSGDFLAIMTMLSEKLPGLDPNAPDKEGRTAVLLAALSPRAKETRGIFSVDAHDPAQKNWNSQAYIADQLLHAGARLDLVVADGKTVGELALAAARDAGNAQLAGILTDALKAQPDPKSDFLEAKPPQDLANLPLNQHDTIWTAAFTAIEAGDIGTIDGFLRRGLDVNIDLENSSSLLFLAADDNQLAIVKLLLAHGADVLQKTSWGDTPLQRACWRGYKEIADALIAAGAPKDELSYATGTGDVAALEARDRRQPITPQEARSKIFFAVASGHPDTFDFLWKKLGPLDDTAKGKLLGDLYENAGKWGHANMLPVLEALGATPARDGERALGAAVGLDSLETVKALLERGVPPNPLSPYSRLRNAAGDGRLEIVRLLLDHGADINVQDKGGYTPLGWAAYCGKEDVCLLLLERGADGRIKDHDGRNAAWHAAAGPHCPEALARMIKAGVPVDGKDNHGATILEHMTNFSTPATWRGAFFMKVYSPADLAQFDASERRVVDLLLAAGLDPNGPEGGPVPLIEAMHSQHYVMAQTLLDHGADASLRDKNGGTALYALLSYVRDEARFPMDLFRTLVKRDGDLNRDLPVAGVQPPTQTTYLESLLGSAPRHARSIVSWQEAVRIVLDAGEVFSGVADAKAQTLLQAAARGDLARLQKAVQQGAMIDAAAEKGWNALSIALALGYNEIADWLIDHGADVNGQRGQWICPLSFAIEGGQADMVEKLLAKGASIDGVYGGLYMAVQQKNARIFDALLKAGADPRERSNVTMSTGGKTYTPRSSVMLYLCIESGLTDMASTLLDKGVDADPPNLDGGQNLAFLAVENDRPEILRSLLDHGADPLAKDDEGISALDLARKSHPRLVPMLEEVAKRKPAPAK